MDGTILQSVDLTLANGDPIDGLVAVHKPAIDLHPEEAAVIQKAQSFGEVAYVYFRRFSDHRSPQPLVFVVDNTDERLSNEQLAKLHNDLWLHGVAPLVYIAWPTRIDVLSCARGPDFWGSNERVYNPAAEVEVGVGLELEVSAKVAKELSQRRRFSAFRLAAGTFWDDPQNHALANHDKAAHESLIQAVVHTDEALEGKQNPLLRRLLILTVLIKYLEDREVFPDPRWFGHFHKGARSFFDLLKSDDPDCVTRLLRNLEEKFNGDVFALPSDTKLTKSALRKFAQLVEAKTLKRQRYLWEQFSFAHLPVEVISHLYERFVGSSTAVYTPPFLASMLLDQAMPFAALNGAERVLDPACGSGVFLVGAYRRLVNLWRAKHQWANPDVETLKSILRHQIFGVELEAEAVDLTAFSLALAVCDSLQPNVIWNELRFDRLRTHNILEGDYFDYADEPGDESDGQLGMFDVIVGNPPFESKFSEAAQRIRGTVDVAIPDKQIAYLFLHCAMQLLKPGGRLCMIQPAGFLYNANSHAFRSAIAETGRMTAVLDFVSVRGLYDGADPKTIAIAIGDKTDSPILHLTFRRTFEATQRIGFELDHYDRHWLSIDQIVADPLAARANLLGGGRLNGIAARLRKMRTLSQFVQEKGWLMGEGFIEGSGNKTPGPHLTGQPFLPTSELKSTGINPQSLQIVSATQFYYAPRPELFQPPLVLIKEHESLPMAFWDESVLTFKDKIVGIHAPNTDCDALYALYVCLQKNLAFYQFAVMINSVQSLVGKSTALLKTDIDRLPIPEDKSELELTFWEQAIAEDTLDYFVPFVRLGQNSELLTKRATSVTLQQYSEMYCRMLGSIYDNLRAAEPVFLDGLICQPFYFGPEPLVEWLGPDCEEHLSDLVFDESSPSLRTIRVVRFYLENVIFIIKPDRLRYWIRSTAIRDADDTLTELQQQGY